MKRFVLLMVCLGIMLSLPGCADKVDVDASMATALIFQETETEYAALQLTIDFQSMKLSLDDEPFYSISSSVHSWLDLVPQYMSQDVLVLNGDTAQSSFEPTVFVQNGSPIYYQDYSLSRDGESAVWKLSENGQICGEIAPVYQGIGLSSVASFFVDQQDKVILLGMTNEPLPDTKMVALTYVKAQDGYTLENSVDYSDIWETYGVSLINMPTYLKGYSNIIASEPLQGFLYNERKKLFYLSPYKNGTIQCILDEDRVVSDIPFFDSFRESYAFFDRFTYQNGFYIASFLAFNALEGEYAMFYSSDGTLVGYLLCNNNLITLYGKDHNIADKIEISCFPDVFIPAE